MTLQEDIERRSSTRITADPGISEPEESAEEPDVSETPTTHEADEKMATEKSNTYPSVDNEEKSIATSLPEVSEQAYDSQDKINKSPVTDLPEEEVGLYSSADELHTALLTESSEQRSDVEDLVFAPK